MIGLNARLSILVAILFAIVFAIVSMIMNYLGVMDISMYVMIALVTIGFQYLIGPKIVEWTMGVEYIKENQYPELFAMVKEQSKRAGIPMPKIGIAKISVPNAFAFGRSTADGRVCVTEGIMRLLSPEELKAVLGHEISHLKNRDVLFITVLSVIPLIMYRIFINLTFYGQNRRREGGNNAALIGIAAFLAYFVTNLLVLYASRIREYFADKGSIALGNSPQAMATALYKLVYGAARTPREALQSVEGVKAFFANDVSRAYQEIKDLAQLDLNKDGTIDANELFSLRNKQIKVSGTQKMMEILSTHPNMLKRIKHLSECK